MYRRVDSPPPERARHATEFIFAVFMNLVSRDGLAAMAQIIFDMCGVAIDLVHIPKEKLKNRPRVDTLLEAANAALNAKHVFSFVLGPVHLDMVRLGYLLPLITIGRDLLRHAGNFYDLLYANLSLWENEVHDMLVSFHEKSAPFTKDNPTLADNLQAVHNHFQESAERGAETAAKNRDLRKEARDAGIKEGEERARDQAQKDADKALNDAIDKIRGKLGDGGDKNKG